MKKAIRIFAFFTLTFFIGSSIANIYLEWPAPMPSWLFHTTVFALRMIGISDDRNTDEAEMMTTLIIACISWTFTGLVLWLLAVAVRRCRSRHRS